MTGVQTCALPISRKLVAFSFCSRALNVFAISALMSLSFVCPFIGARCAYYFCGRDCLCASVCGCVPVCVCVAVCARVCVRVVCVSALGICVPAHVAAFIFTNVAVRRRLCVWVCGCAALGVCRGDKECVPSPALLLSELGCGSLGAPVAVMACS